MIPRRVQNKAIILFIIISFFLSFASISINNNSHIINYTDNREQKVPEIALPALPYWAIRQNATKVYRLFESVNFTINTFNLGSGDADNAKMKISFSNNSTQFYDMTFIGNDRFRCEYIPDYDAPLGFQKVNFLVYNATNELMNSQATSTNFTIVSNYLVHVNSSQYYIGDTVYGEMLVTNFDTYDFTWNTTIVDILDEAIQTNIINFDKNIVQFIFALRNESFSNNRFYYVQLNMTDKNLGRKETAYFPFYISNNKPIISSNIDLSPQEVLRTEDFTISFNATDIESKSKDLIPWMSIYDAEGNRVIQNQIAFDSDNLFSESFNIPANRPIGKYRVNVTLTDPHGASSSKITYLTVENNLPEIHSYSINEFQMDQKISIFYGRNLVFSFNVSDIEGVAYVKVGLLNENDEWFNITRNYIGEDTEITIRTFDLIDGIWYVYIYVIDSDGAIVSLTDDYDKAPQGIRIIPDVVSYYLPWILFFGGITFGLLLGIVVAYSYMKSRRDTQKITPKKKEIPAKKQIAQKRLKTKSSIQEPEKKATEEFTKEKEKEKEEFPQRKIKRKL
ncbi:MAG: hypothetical protein ACFFA4_00130 [Promethearchaeota archaeon]